jgi:hypothetical protein
MNDIAGLAGQRLSSPEGAGNTAQTGQRAVSGAEKNAFQSALKPAVKEDLPEMNKEDLRGQLAEAAKNLRLSTGMQMRQTVTQFAKDYEE